MPIFSAKDLNTNFSESTNGHRTIFDGVKADEFTAANTLDPYQVTASTTANVVILTGAGNDTIDTSNVTGMTFINAGSGSNTLTVSATSNANITLCLAATPVWTQDTIYNFHAGDSITFSGETTAMEFIRGNNLVFTAFNPAVPGSAIYATLVNPSSIGGITQTPTGIVLHG
jgi:hypothetical protein